MHALKIKQKAKELFEKAHFIVQINNEDDYNNALTLMDELIEDYDENHDLIHVLSATINAWEDSSTEFQDFNKRIEDLPADVSLLKLLMEQHGLGVADFPELGDKSHLSRILNNERSLTKNHILILSEKFNISPALFFER